VVRVVVVPLVPVVVWLVPPPLAVTVASVECVPTEAVELYSIPDVVCVFVLETLDSDAVGPVPAGIVCPAVWIGVLATVGEVEIVVGILLPVLPTAVCVDEILVMVTELDGAVDVEVDLKIILSELSRKLLLTLYRI